MSNWFSDRSLTAILRKIRLIILPERVLGNPGAYCITSGIAKGPIFSRTAKKNTREDNFKKKKLKI